MRPFSRPKLGVFADDFLDDEGGKTPLGSGGISSKRGSNVTILGKV